jgi:hypothetical protein
MTTDEMDTKTDRYAKSDATSFPAAEKLDYYIEADGILNALIIQQQEDRNESTPDPVDTIAGQTAYAAPARIHHVNWLQIDYGNGFVAARYVRESTLIAWFGSEYANILAGWSGSYPIYNYKGNSFNIYPAATTDTAGTGRLKYSIETIPLDLDRGSNDTPALVPVNFHYLHCAYAAMSWLDEDDTLRAKAEKKWTQGVRTMLDTMFGRAAEEEIIGKVMADDDFDYADSFGLSSNSSNVNYIDDETPSGTIDGVNDTFTLAHAPTPADSLMLFFNGQELAQGVDYTLVTNVITFLTPPDAGFAGLPFRAFYRR